MQDVVFRACPKDVECKEISDYMNIGPVNPATGNATELGISMVGSGFITATDGVTSWGITAGHLCAEPPHPLTTSEGAHIKGSSKIQVNMWGGASYVARIVRVYPLIDMCVLEIGAPLKPARLASVPPRPGERVYTLAAPFGFYSSTMIPTFEGFYSGIRGTGVSTQAVYTIPARPGSSGSAIFNSRGHVVGMTSMALVQFENMCLSPPFEAVHAVIQATIEHANTSRRKR
jgi:S1-C subfamily serine protease